MKHYISFQYNHHEILGIDKLGYHVRAIVDAENPENYEECVAIVPKKIYRNLRKKWEKEKERYCSFHKEISYAGYQYSLGLEAEEVGWIELEVEYDKTTYEIKKQKFPMFLVIDNEYNGTMEIDMEHG